jgi:hypothetical protein
MKFEEKLAALWDDPRSVAPIFYLLTYASYGMVVLGFLIFIYMIFGLSTLLYLSAGAIVAIAFALIFLVFGRGLLRLFSH